MNISTSSLPRYADVSMGRIMEAFGNLTQIHSDVSNMLGAAMRVDEILDLLEMPRDKLLALTNEIQDVKKSKSKKKNRRGGNDGDEDDFFGNGSSGKTASAGASPADSDVGGDSLAGGSGDSGSIIHNSNPNDISLALRNVDLITPSGVRLAKNINICARDDYQKGLEGGLMVTGPNGSGKTSLFRQMANLWPVRKGTIQRPQNVFLVPQQCYMVLGSLEEQVSYPTKSPKDESELAEYRYKVQEALKQVDLLYLLERHGWGNGETFDASTGKSSPKAAAELGAKPATKTSEIAWENTLSLGEQQRICLCRAFFHESKFVVLDECTSAVAAEIEETLYTRLRAKGVQCVTISQRLAKNLAQFHEREILLGAENRQGHVVR